MLLIFKFSLNSNKFVVKCILSNVLVNLPLKIITLYWRFRLVMTIDFLAEVKSNKLHSEITKGKHLFATPKTLQ